MSTADSSAPDTGYAPERWAFDDEVSRVFDDMLHRSIPQYDAMRDAVTALARRYRKPVTDVVDLGCSRGGAIATLVDDDTNNAYVGVEVSGPMLDAARARFTGNPKVRILDLDLRRDYPDCTASVTLSVFTLMFIPIEHRQHVATQIAQHTRTGGVLIMCEKMLGATDAINHQMVEDYHAMKAANGYTREDIERKQLALEGVLVPMTARWNEDMLRTAGFREVDCFWRWNNFGGFIAIK